MLVPGPLISLVIQPISTETPNFSRALNQFQKEDPTYKVRVEHGSKEVRPLERSFLPIELTTLCIYGRRSSLAWVNDTSKYTPNR
jgi:hypothetical protein